MNRRLGVLVALATALALLVGVGGCSIIPSGKTTITAYFTDSAGLFVGNDVGVLGVPVGKVTAIKPEGQQVKVTLEVDKDQPIPAGVAAAVVSRSVATDRYVELTPVYTGGPKMQSGAVIPADRTRTPVEFDQVLASIGDFARGINGSGAAKGAIKDFLDAGANALSGNGGLINQSIHSLADASNGISVQRGNATSTLVSLDQLTSKLAANKGTVRAFVRQVSAATHLLAQERTNFKTSIRSATKMIRVVANFARTNRAEITRAVNQSNGVMRTVLDKRTQTAEILRVLPLTLQNLQRMLAPDGRIRVRLDLTTLLPVLGNILPTLCTVLPGDLCSLIGTDPPILGQLLDQLFGILP
jgi:virulence factor Mce-like protein